MTDERVTWDGPFRIEAVRHDPTRGGIDRWRIDAVLPRTGQLLLLHTWQERIAGTLAAAQTTDVLWLTGYSKPNPYSGGWWNTVTAVEAPPSDTLDDSDWAAIDAMLDEEAAR